MSVLQRTIRMFVLAALAVAGQAVSAQEGYHPFSEPMEFDPDWQFFAPVQLQDLQDLTARQRANTGFYLTYDRLSIGLNRPTNETPSNKIDFTWGNRFDFGWMNSKESGWMFSATSVSGPNVYNKYEQQRLNQAIPVATNAAIVPIAFQNDFGDERKYIIHDSVNVGNFNSFEANKTWRMEPYRYGGILEPMVGLRYASFKDTAANDIYDTRLATAADLPPLVAGQSVELMTRERVLTDNNMLLGQIGFRYTKFINRWTLSNDMKFFGGAVYQSQATSTQTITTAYATPPAVGAIAPVDNLQTTTYGGSKGDNRSTIGFDLRVEGAYKATKYLDFRGGFAMMYFGRGIWRGATVTDTGPQDHRNQNLIMPAFTFGVALNR